MCLVVQGDQFIRFTDKQVHQVGNTVLRYHNTVATMAKNQAHANNPCEGRQAPSTNKGKDYAKVVFDRWQQDFRNDPSFDELRDIHVEGDNLEHMLCGYGDYLRLNNILQNNNTGKYQSKYQSPQTKAKLFERIDDGSTRQEFESGEDAYKDPCLLYTSDAADE